MEDKKKGSEILTQAKQAGTDTGAVALGIVAGNVAVKLVKQDNLMGNAALTVGGFAGAVMIKNKFVRNAMIGLTVFGGLRLLTIGVNAVTAPGAVKGLAGFIPESVKEKIRTFVPQINGVEQLIGEDDFGDVNLDDDDNGNGTGNIEDVDYIDMTHEKAMAGPGEVSLLV